MRLASRADLHRGRPCPAECGEIWPGDVLEHSIARRASSALLDQLGDASAASAPVQLGPGMQRVIDFLVRFAGGDGDGARDAITSFTDIPGSLAATVVEDVMRLHRLTPF